MAFAAPLIAAGISAAGSVAGGLLSKSGGVDLAAQEQFSQQQLQEQEQFQREMAQNSIQWRVKDAQAAGVSPLVALGAPTFSPSLSVGGVDYGASRGDNSGLGAGISRAGQNLGDAVGKSLTPQDKSQQLYQSTIQQQQIKSNDLDIQIKGAKLAAAQRVLNAPSAPGVASSSGGLAGQGSVAGMGDVKVVPAKEESRNPNDVGMSGGTSPIGGWEVSDNGFTLQRKLPDSIVASASPWNPEYLISAAKNRLLPGIPPPMEALPPGTVRWRYRGLGKWDATPYWPGENMR